MTRVRLTEQSIANIKVADEALIKKVSGGYLVTVRNKKGHARLQNGEGLAIYETSLAAKKALKRHNPGIKFVKSKVLPSLAMRL